MKKRLLSTVIILALILSFTPLVSLNAEAAASYSVSKALEYAKAHWNDGVGACATFVSRCVIAGGINIKSQSTTRDCYEAVCKATGLPQKQLKLNSSGQATKALNKDILAAGDIVFQYCNTHKKSPHILLCSGFNKNGAALYYAHNSALNNNTYRLNKNTGSGHDTSCDIVGKVVHISSLDKQDYTVELFNNYSGRNYMPAVSASNFNSGDFFSRDSSVATVTGDASVKRIDSCDSLKIVNSSAGSSGKDLVFATHTSGRTVDGAYAENQTLTLGFWAKASSPGAKMFFRWGYESSYRSVTLTGDWAYYTVKMDKTTANNSHMHPYVDRTGTVWLSEIQREEGNTATAYSAETGGKLGNLTVTSGEKYTGLPAPERSGYTFNGWYTKPAGGTLITTSSNVLPGHIRLFAHWTAHSGASAVDDLILAIGSVSWSSGEAIAAARSAYDALPETQKALVKNLDLLTAAEARYGLWKRGDINCDGRIDMQDLSILLSVYGSQSAQSDIVPDSFINANDLSVLLINYGAKL